MVTDLILVNMLCNTLMPNIHGHSPALAILPQPCLFGKMMTPVCLQGTYTRHPARAI